MMWMDDYKYINNLPAHGIAFEFLRRNPIYRNNYVDYIKRKKKLELAHGVLQSKNQLDWYRDDNSWIFIPDKSDDVAIDDWRKTTIFKENLEPVMVNFEQFYKKKWQLDKMMPSPDLPCSEEIIFRPSNNYPYYPQDVDDVGKYFIEPTPEEILGIEGSSSQQNPRYIVSVICLDEYLDPQLESLKKYAKEQHKQRKGALKLGASKKRKFQGDISRIKTLLRILDSDLSKENSKELAELLFPEEGSGFENEQCAEHDLDDESKVAKRYRDTDYLKLLSIYDKK